MISSGEAGKATLQRGKTNRPHSIEQGRSM
jgi:hypothetical protein